MLLPFSAWVLKTRVLKVCNLIWLEYKLQKSLMIPCYRSLFESKFDCRF
jgi:hypothetical protein